jgi:hypothetical protein
MSDNIGRITVPTVLNSGQTFPLTTQHPFGFSIERPMIVHRFGSLDAKQEQRYYVGIGPRKFQFKRPNLGWTESNQLKAFWESMPGASKALTDTVPNPRWLDRRRCWSPFQLVQVWFKYLRNTGQGTIEVIYPSRESRVGARASPCCRRQNSLPILCFLNPPGPTFRWGSSNGPKYGLAV